MEERTIWFLLMIIAAGVILGSVILNIEGQFMAVVAFLAVAVLLVGWYKTVWVPSKLKVENK